MRLPFRRVELSDKALVRQYTQQSGRHNCDLNFMNICSWQFLYNTQLAIWNDWLIFRFYADGHLAYMLPLGDGDYKEVLLAMIDDAQKEGHPFLLLGVCQGCVDIMEAAMPDFFRFNYDRDYCDYIYDRTALETLAGKKLQPKRNFVNRFIRNNPDYEYRPLTSDLIPLCLELDKKWMNSKDQIENDPDYKNERLSMKFVFEHWDELDGIGGTIFAGGKLVAFSFGACINKTTFDVCVEKADSEVEGAYAIINREFVRHLPPQFNLINREEDLGIEGLRHAKLSYQPSILLPKYAAMSKHPLHDEKTL